jgi:hypothetical protein
MAVRAFMMFLLQLACIAAAVFALIVVAAPFIMPLHIGAGGHGRWLFSAAPRLVALGTASVAPVYFTMKSILDSK